MVILVLTRLAIPIDNDLVFTPSGGGKCTSEMLSGFSFITNPLRSTSGHSLPDSTNRNGYLNREGFNNRLVENVLSKKQLSVFGSDGLLEIGSQT